MSQSFREGYRLLLVYELLVHCLLYTSIIKDDPERRFVVVSAPGKRNAEDTKVTDALIRYYKEFTSDKDVTQTQQWIIERYRAITEELGLKDSIIQEIAEDIYRCV